MKKCSFPGCIKPHCAKGLCNSHWAQQRRGHKLTPILTHESDEERFERNVRRDDETGCWVWVGSGSGKFYNKETGEGGYGQLRLHGKSYMAHRWSWQKHNGVELSPEDTIDHLCRNSRCVNPEHLERVSRTENVKRKNLYWALHHENKKLRSFLESQGFEVDKILLSTSE